MAGQDPVTFMNTAVRSGGGLVVRIPPNVIRYLKLEKGDFVEISIVKKSEG